MEGGCGDLHVVRQKNRRVRCYAGYSAAGRHAKHACLPGVPAGNVGCRHDVVIDGVWWIIGVFALALCRLSGSFNSNKTLFSYCDACVFACCLHGEFAGGSAVLQDSAEVDFWDRTLGGRGVFKDCRLCFETRRYGWRSSSRVAADWRSEEGL